MGDKKEFKYELLEDAKLEASERIKKVTKICINKFFDYLENKIVDVPNIIEQLKNDSRMEEELVSLWSEQLFKEALIPSAYIGLTDEQLISNFKSEGYFDGIFTGYTLVMMALVDKGISKDKIIDIRNHVRPNLIGNHYDNINKIIDKYKDDKYNWIEKK